MDLALDLESDDYDYQESQIQVLPIPLFCCVPSGGSHYLSEPYLWSQGDYRD